MPDRDWRGARRSRGREVAGVQGQSPGAGSEPAAKARAAISDHSAALRPSVSLSRSTNSSALSGSGGHHVGAGRPHPAVGLLEDDVDAVEKALDRNRVRGECMAGAGPANDGFGHG